jgi:putative FmdB family regulatory protein
MPIYEFKCESCGHEFEELKSSKEDINTMPCKKCGAVSQKKMSKFSSVIAGGSTTEPVDVTIGRAANQRWQQYHDRQSERRKDKSLENFDLPQSKDGKYMPVMALGGKVEKEKRNEFSTALQEHRTEREKKGIPQFSDSEVSATSKSI